MKPEVFLKNIDLVSEASNGIDSLRKYILFLAVQGRLFQHDVDKSTGYPPGWKTLALDEIGDWGSGSTPLRGNSEYYGGDIPWFKSGELNEGTIFDSEEKITKKALAECSLRMNKVGDVLIAMYGATVGKTAIMGVEGTTNQAVCACTCNKLINNKYLLLLLKGFKDKFISMGAGAAQPNISKMKIVSTVVPVPPYAEQKRIVAKVDQLMILCDELEAKQEKQTQTRQQLNDVTLNALLSATSPKEFEKHWQRIVDNFDLLYDDLENLQFLRQGILQLAVQGNLGQKSTDDEAATVLLEKIKKDKGVVGSFQKINGPVPLPARWEWALISDVSIKVQYGFNASAKDVGEAQMVRITDIQNNKVDWANVPFCSINKIELERYRLNKNDLLIARTGGTIGKSFQVDNCPQDAIFASYLIRIVPSPRIHQKYFKVFADSALYWTQLKEKSRGAAQPNVNGTSLSGLLFPVPPYEEQKRIVAKVNQLMALCDELEKKIVAKSDTLEKLTESLLRVN